MKLENPIPHTEVRLKPWGRIFYTETADGPVRAAEFLRGTLDEAERIRQDMVTVAGRLLGEDI